MLFAAKDLSFCLQHRCCLPRCPTLALQKARPSDDSVSALSADSLSALSTARSFLRFAKQAPTVAPPTVTEFPDRLAHVSQACLPPGAPLFFQQLRPARFCSLPPEAT